MNFRKDQTVYYTQILIFEDAKLSINCHVPLEKFNILVVIRYSRICNEIIGQSFRLGKLLLLKCLLSFLSFKCVYLKV